MKRNMPEFYREKCYVRKIPTKHFERDVEDVSQS